jgi:hypothetical protein
MLHIRESLLVPATVRIGVTGQRSLADEAQIRRSVRKVLNRLDQIFSNTPHHLIAFTSLSEGSDRLLAYEVLDWPLQGTARDARLHLILPVPEEEYLEECATLESREACSSFLDRASAVTVSGSSEMDREMVCEEIGHRIVQTCDVLVAIWNGEPSIRSSGTAEMVKYARRLGRTLFWIHAESGNIVEERHADGILESYEYLDMFNAEKVDAGEIVHRCRFRYDRLLKIAKLSDLDDDFLRPLQKSLLPYYAFLNILTERYERRYMWTGTAVYVLAAMAIGTVTIQALFFPQSPWLLWTEVAAMLAILLLISGFGLGDFHRKWLDYRFLSERMRTALFLSLFCVRVEKPPSPFLYRVGLASCDWRETAFDRILEERPLEYCSIDLPFEKLKIFLQTAWIEDQIAFYTKASAWNSKRFALLSQAVDILFTLTLIVAALHALEIGYVYRAIEIDFTSLFTALTIILPACGMALGAIRIKREYLRNAERYAHMIRPLSVIRNQMAQAENTGTLVLCLREANEITLREQEDWRAVFTFRDLETP